MISFKNDIIVYKALRMGIQVTICGEEYKMIDDAINIKGTITEDGITEDCWLTAVHGDQLPWFISLCKRASNEEIFVIAANIALNERRK